MSLPPLVTAGRIDRLRDRFQAAECDGLLVSNLTNVRYLTGFTGSAGFLVIGERACLVTDGRYETQAHEQVAASGAGVDVAISSYEQRQAAEAAMGACERVGLEAASVTWDQQRSYAEWFRDVVPTKELVESLRMVKDDAELARMQAAADIADAALAHLRPLLLTGITEAGFALELDTEMRRRGAKGSAFETIVAAGPNAAKPHHRPSSRPIGRGELVVIDFGAIVDGYRSDMTRTFLTGEPTPDQARLYGVVRAAQAAGVAAVGDGVAASVVDAACRDVIKEAGWGDRFVHGTGHGVGLDIHEAPWVNTRSTTTLSPGHIVTVEPGVYLPDFGGVRVEDTVVVTTGGARALTNHPKQPVVS